MRDYKEVLFPKTSEETDQDLREDTGAVPARNPSLGQDSQSSGSASVISCKTSFMNTIFPRARVEGNRIYLSSADTSTRVSDTIFQEARLDGNRSAEAMMRSKGRGSNQGKGSGQGRDSSKDSYGKKGSRKGSDTVHKGSQKGEERGSRHTNAQIQRALQSLQLRVVDPLEDEGVWAIVDDGSNSCCHGQIWRKNAEAKWKKLGFKCILKNSKRHVFGGIGSGSTHSSGKYRMPFAMQLMQSRLNLPGAIDSHEIADKSHPMLLSQTAQAKFGFIKNIRRGTLTLEDYANQGSEVARQKGTGLFMVRIDHLDLGEYLEFAKSSEAAESVIDKGSDAYVDAYVDWIQEEEDTPEDQRWPVPYCNEVEAQLFARSRDEMLTNLIKQNYGCEYCRH